MLTGSGPAHKSTRAIASTATMTSKSSSLSGRALSVRCACGVFSRTFDSSVAVVVVVEEEVVVTMV